MDITIVDSIMGSGKSTWARKYMNENPSYRWWYVTPYLVDIEDKVIPECAHLHIQQPEYDVLSPGSSKHEHLCQLIKAGANIACSHKLFLSINPTKDFVELLKSQKYHVIIDEAPDIITANSISQDDIKNLVSSNTIRIDEMTSEIIKENKDYKGSYSALLDLSYSGKLYMPNNESNAFVWLYKTDIFSAFESVVILTYLFRNSYLRSYFDFTGLKYQIDDGKIFSPLDGKDEEERKRIIKSHINIYDGSLNDVGQKKYSITQLSHAWYQDKKNEPYRKQLYNNAYNYLHNLCKARSNTALYTVYKDVVDKYPLRSYKKCFIPCNQRVSNDYRDRKYLAYLINLYENPAITNFFARRTPHDQKAYSLELLLQWIWRSAIRKEDMEDICIYIPSSRMRELLTKWLNE